VSSRRIRVFRVATDRLNYRFSYNQTEAALLRRSISGRSNITLDVLRRIALWKLNRVLNVPPTTLKVLAAISSKRNLTERSPISKLAIKSLVACEGVGFPMASAFLKFLRPEIFPIIDVRAYRALTGKKLRYHKYSLDLYLTYIRRLRDIATVARKKFSEVDEQLYCFDKKHNGPI
jgi:hypothetical protein